MGSAQVAWSRALVDRLANRTVTQASHATHAAHFAPGNRSEEPGSSSSSSGARAVWEKRLVFLSGGDEFDLAALYQAADVVLDAFPASGYADSLQVATIFVV